MNYTELQQAVLDDTHKADYLLDIPRFVEQGEAFIRSKLEAYGLEYSFTDLDRVVADGPVYTLPARVTLIRYVQSAIGGRTLSKVDEPTIHHYQTLNTVDMFAMRPTQIVFAGTPATLAELPMQYLGMPPALTVTPTNALLTDYPQIYIDAASIYVYKRAQDYESAQLSQNACESFIAEINRRIKKQLGGAQSANAYNVGHRSSY